MNIKEKIYQKTNLKIYQILIIIFLLAFITLATTKLFVNQAERHFSK